MAARATFDLNTGVWFRRGRLLIVSPVRGHHRRYQAETPPIPLSRFAEPALLLLPSGLNNWGFALADRSLAFADTTSKAKGQYDRADYNQKFFHESPISMFYQNLFLSYARIKSSIESDLCAGSCPRVTKMSREAYPQLCAFCIDIWAHGADIGINEIIWRR
jgi:hypothetical protein